jgi:hypothetical protein
MHALVQRSYKRFCELPIRNKWNIHIHGFAPNNRPVGGFSRECTRRNIYDEINAPAQ